EDVKDARLQRLQALIREQQAAFNASKVGQTLPVLVTGTGRLEGQLHGRSPYLHAVHFDGPVDLIGEIVDVEIIGSSLNSLSGQMKSLSEAAA
ncbi:MAG: TRAM domain-containing protein, partial [Pseudomonadota bacterium]